MLSYCVALLAAAADDDLPLVKRDGYVNYTVQFNAGTSLIPASSSFALETSGATPDITPIAGTIACINGTDTFTPGPVPASIQMHGKTWSCSFQIKVTSAHETAGQIAPFDVQVKLTGTDPLMPAFYVPKKPTTHVFVYTGVSLTAQGSIVDTSYNTLDITGV